MRHLKLVPVSMAGAVLFRVSLAFAVPTMGSINFDGIGSATQGTLPDGSHVAVGVAYADPSLGVGPNHIVQAEIGFYRVCTKAGVCQPTNSIDRLFQNPPFQVGQCWTLDRAGFGGAFATAQVAYDALADRWLFVAPSADTNAQGVCIALSDTSDPNGTYTRNFFPTPLYTSGSHPGTPHLGVWPDGYYVHFDNSVDGSGNEAIYVFPRQLLLAGGWQDAQGFLVPLAGYPRPVTFTGTTVPPAGAPELFIGETSGVFGGIQMVTGIEVRSLHIDWTTPANSTFTLVNTFNGAYDQPYRYPGGIINQGSLVPQQGTTAGLGAQNGYMYTPVNYRNMGSFQSIVVSHNVDLAPQGSLYADAATRWSEIRVNGSTMTLNQSANYHPDSNSSWMGSLAIDKSGNIGMVTNESSSSVKPSLRVTGRLASDGLTQMSQGNNVVISSGSVITDPNTAFEVWAPESLMTDPDGCTIWLSGNYVLSSNWQTRITSFTLPGCVNLPQNINCGGTATGSWLSDTGTGGSQKSWTNAVNTSLLTGTIPPQTVLQHGRVGNPLTYNFTGLVANSSHPVTLYFVENFWGTTGSRVFTVNSNGTAKLSNFDIFAAAGAKFKAVQRSFTATADSTGKIALTFVPSHDNASIEGIIVQ